MHSSINCRGKLLRVISDAFVFISFGWLVGALFICLLLLLRGLLWFFSFLTESYIAQGGLGLSYPPVSTS